MAHNSVLRILKKAWTAGHGKDKSKGNYHVGMDELELVISWQDYMEPQFTRFTDDRGYQSMKVKIVKNKKK